MRGFEALLLAALGLGGLCAPLAALVLDFNGIKGAADAQGARKGPTCAADEDCGPRKLCVALRGEQRFCAACRGPWRPCRREASCCPRARCANDACAPGEDAASGPESRTDPPGGLDAAGLTELPVEENKPRRKPNTKKSQSIKGQEGESCLRTSDCGPGLCCARHFWTKICKPVLLEGQLCSRRGHKDTAQAPEIFQRCDCGPGLACRSQGSWQHSRLRVCQKVQKGANASP